MSVKKNIDLSALIEAAGGDSAIMTELVRIFFDTTNREMDRLNDAVDDGDFETISRVAHKLVGSSMACGLIALATDLRELEQLSKPSLPEDIDERILHIERALAEAQILIQNHMEKAD